MDEVESFLQSMMETIAAAIASPLTSFFPDQTARGLSSAKPFHGLEIQDNTPPQLSPGCCATSHHPAKATFAAFRSPTRLRFTLRRSWTPPAKASQAHSPSLLIDCTAASTRNTAALHSSLPHHHHRRHLRRRHRVPFQSSLHCPVCLLLGHILAIRMHASPSLALDLTFATNTLSRY